MIYLFLDRDVVKLLYLKKTILNQFDVAIFQKKYHTELTSDGKITNLDLVASATKEALNESMGNKLGTKEVTLILPQKNFKFMRVLVPGDIAPSSIEAFVKGKARNTAGITEEDYYLDFYTKDILDKKEVLLFAIKVEEVDKYREALSLVGLKLIRAFPNTLGYFSLFDKTLRKTKKENIFYLNYEKSFGLGYLFDSSGPVNEERWTAEIKEYGDFKEQVKTKMENFEAKNIKINRIVLGGKDSDGVRQDLFTKEVGVWVNPLKKIILNFYKETLKSLVISKREPFPILGFEECLGAFIFLKEKKNFLLLKKKRTMRKIRYYGDKRNLPKKEILIFVASFLLSFLFFVLLIKTKPNINLNFIRSKTIPTVVTPTIPVPTLSPTPTINKEEIKIKVLNGSGIVGKASKVKALLKEKGYQNILTGNADNFDYQITEIRAKKDASSVIEELKKDLKENTKSFKETTSNKDQVADIVLVIGQDFK